MNGTETSNSSSSDFLTLNEVTDLLILARRKGNPDEITYYKGLVERKEKGEKIPKISSVWPVQDTEQYQQGDNISSPRRRIWQHPELLDEKVQSFDRDYLLLWTEELYTTYKIKPPDDFKILPDEKLRQHIKTSSTSEKVRGIYEKKKIELRESGAIDSNAEALEILTYGDPVDHMIRVFKKDHVGDLILAKSYIACIGASLCSNTHGLHPGTTGESGYGKTHSMETIIHQIPEKYVFSGSFSDQALFYGNLLPGTIIFLDDAQDVKDIHKTIIKQYTSYYQKALTRTSTINHKESKTNKVDLKPRCPIFINSVSGQFQMQFLNRQLNLTVDEDHSEEIFQRQLYGGITGNTGFTKDNDWIIVRRIWEILKERDPVNVKIPFLAKILWKNKENPRNFPMFIDTIFAFAAIYQFQREKDDEGYIIAEKQDLNAALEIWRYISREQQSKLNKRELIVMQRIVDLIKASNSNPPSVERRLLLSSLKNITSGDLTHILKGRKNPDGSYDGGLYNKVPGLHHERVSTKEESMVRTRYIEVITYTGSLDTFAQFGNIAEWPDQ